MVYIYWKTLIAQTMLEFMLPKAKPDVPKDLYTLQSSMDCSNLIQQSSSSLIRLTRRMFYRFPAIRRWEQTDDIFQNSMIRLHRALQCCKVESPRHFINLAAVQIRRELIDLVRKYKAESNFAANHHSDSLIVQNICDISKQAEALVDLEKWSEFHLLVESLPEEEKDVVDLLWYQELTQEDAAKLLDISVRTVKRRWQSARIKLFETLV
jgi:RNA polymerase sigma factor (sigma-70 family)